MAMYVVLEYLIDCPAPIAAELVADWGSGIVEMAHNVDVFSMRQ